jgi:tetratricopeptide (TPR) repeat protein
MADSTGRTGAAPTARQVDVVCERAVAFHMQGDLAPAEQLYRQVLSVRPRDFQALLMLGVLAAQTGRAHAGVELFRQAIDVDANSFLAYNNLGIVLTRLGSHDEAVACFDKAVRLSPQYADAYSNRGIALGHLGRAREALASCDTAIGLQPGAASAHNNRGSLLREAGRFDEAIQSYTRALALQPDFVAAHINCADALREAGRLEEALVSAERALALSPRLPEALVSKGDVLQKLQRREDALACYDEAIAVDPTCATAFSSRGAVLCELNRAEEALVSCERAIELAPTAVDAHVNRGVALEALYRFDEALGAYDRAIALNAGERAAYINRGGVLMQLGRFDEAIASYDRCIALNAEDAEAHSTKSFHLLLLGRFEQGWPLYEWRNRRGPSFPARALRLPTPAWRGEDSVRGKTLFIHWEQGLGDTLQFCRYARLAEERGAHVVLEVQPQLRRLLRSLSPTIDIVTDLGAAAAADYHCPLLSLPGVFGTTVASIPAAVPYLSAEPERVARWRDRIGTDGYKIGICWQGSTGPVDAGRSFPLALFRHIAAIPGVRLISLQKRQGIEQLRTLPAGMSVETLGEDFDQPPDAFCDAAAAMETLDLVITSDTAIAHLAGALARPAWIVLKRVPDWRWLLQADTSPWYPGHRLLRQERAGDWEEVFERIRAELLTQMLRVELARARSTEESRRRDPGQ